MAVKILWDLIQISLDTKPVNCQHLWPAQSHKTDLCHHRLSWISLCLSLKYQLFYFSVAWATYSMAGPYCALALQKRQGRGAFPPWCTPCCTNTCRILSSVHSSYLFTHASAQLLSLLWGFLQLGPYLSIWSWAGLIIIGDYKMLSKVMFTWDTDQVLLTIQRVIMLEIYHFIHHQQVSVKKKCIWMSLNAKNSSGYISYVVMRKC